MENPTNKEVDLAIEKLLKNNNMKTKNYYAEKLMVLLNDDDLTDEKLREAAEGLLPNICDFLNGVGLSKDKKPSKLKQMFLDFPEIESIQFDNLSEITCLTRYGKYFCATLKELRRFLIEEQELRNI